MSDQADKPLMPYASHVAAGTGRTPIGIVMFAASHLLLGGVLLLTAWILAHQAMRRGPSTPLVDWLVAVLVALLAVPMITGAVALLLKGTLAWATAVASFTMLALCEALTILYACGMTVRYIGQGNADVTWAGIFLAFSLSQALLCAVVVGYLGSEKARATFGLPPGDTTPTIRRLRRLTLITYALALTIGPFLSHVGILYPD